jgi:hypothetical protein
MLFTHFRVCRQAPLSQAHNHVHNLQLVSNLRVVEKATPLLFVLLVQQYRSRLVHRLMRYQQREKRKLEGVLMTMTMPRCAATTDYLVRMIRCTRIADDSHRLAARSHCSRRSHAKEECVRTATILGNLAHSRAIGITRIDTGSALIAAHTMELIIRMPTMILQPLFQSLPAIYLYLKPALHLRLLLLLRWRL